jgi:hypothetical protein
MKYEKELPCIIMAAPFDSVYFSICITPRQIITVQNMVTKDKNAMPMGYSAPALLAAINAATVEPTEITAQILTSAAII